MPVFCQRQYFVNANNFVDTNNFVDANTFVDACILLAPTFCRCRYFSWHQYFLTANIFDFV